MLVSPKDAVMRPMGCLSPSAAPSGSVLTANMMAKAASTIRGLLRIDTSAQ
jgi:hypothetical protein